MSVDQFLGRITKSELYCYRRSSVVCRFIGRSVCLSRPWTMHTIAEPIEMPFGMWTQVGPRNHVCLLNGVQIPLNKRQFWGRRRTGSGHALPFRRTEILLILSSLRSVQTSSPAIRLRLWSPRVVDFIRQGSSDSCRRCFETQQTSNGMAAAFLPDGDRRECRWVMAACV